MNYGKKNKVITIVLLICFIGCLIFIVYDKFINKSQCEDNLTEETDSQEGMCILSTSDDGISLSSEYQTEEGNNIIVKVTFLDNGIMQLLSNKGDTIIEYSQGTYEVIGNELVYNKIYSNFSYEGKDFWESNYDFSQDGLSQLELFTIEDGKLINDSYVTGDSDEKVTLIKVK